MDVVVRAQPGATVGDFAQALAEHVAAHRPEITRVAPVTAGVPWPAGQSLAECGLRNGDLLSVEPVPESWQRRDGQPLAAKAILRIVSGPGKGRSVTLTGNTATLGRAYDCTVRLDDPMVSRLHARIVFGGDQPTVVDEGSAAGTAVDGVRVNLPTQIRWGTTTITLGATATVLDKVSDHTHATVDAAVLRPPRFGEPLTAQTVDIAAPPSKPPRPHFPWAMMLLPLIMGVGLFATGWNITGLAIVLGWPAVMLADYWLQLRHAAKEFARELNVWRQDLDLVLDRIDRHAEAQRQRAQTDHPGIDTLRARIPGADPLLWCRKPAAEDFLTVRVGLGPVRALLSGNLATGGDRAEASQAARDLDRRRLLLDAPILHHLRGSTVTAVTGPLDAVDAAVRALLIRLCADHSPAEVSIAAVLSPRTEYQETWLRWLPHANPVAGLSPVAVGGVNGQALLDALTADHGSHGITLCLIDEDAGVPRRRVEMLAAAGNPRLRLLWTGTSVASVPSSTNTVLDLTASIAADAAIAATAAGDREAVTSVACLAASDRRNLAILTDTDTLDLVTAWSLARSLHPRSDAVALRPADTDLPDALRLPDLSADLTTLDDPAIVTERWRASQGLRAQLGLGIDGTVTIDLRDDGPHALIAGTTGAGKSELLQTLLCSLAVNNPPERLTFLLVDYKGGAAFRECAQLPHTVGYITDLNPAEVRRALISLHAEITTRERLLAHHGAKDLTQLQARNPRHAPPSLLICVDEFAALTAEVPDFIDGVVSIAQRGRSLGMHLILATQRPAGVVTANIQANTDLRIALRVASPDDSQDVIDRPDAARISRRTPGRAFLRRIGHGSTELIQVAWAGAREQQHTTPELVRIRPFTATASMQPQPEGRTHPHTDLERLVATVTSAFTATGAQSPRRPWLPPLPNHIPLETLGSSPDPVQLTIGMLDNPHHQQQKPLTVDYARIGNLLAHGASRSGKTELLRTVAVASTLANPAKPPHIYGIDFGGGGLACLRNWPSTATIVTQADIPRTLRMLRWLHQTVRQRTDLLARNHLADLGQLRPEHRPPHIHVLIDNIPALLNAMEGTPRGVTHTDMLTEVLQDGRKTGIHVTATTPSRALLPIEIQATFGMRLVLRMAASDDYDLLAVPSNVLHADTAPGRGLLDQAEIHIAVADPVRCVAPPSAVEHLAAHPPTRIPAMPHVVSVDDLPQPDDDLIAVAVDAESVQPVTVPLRGNVLLIAGRRASGRSSMLTGIARQARRSHRPPERVVTITAGTTADAIEDDIRSSTDGWCLLLVDDVHKLEQDLTAPVDELAKVVRQAVDDGHAAIIAVDTDHARSEPGALTHLGLQSRRGVLVGPDGFDEVIFGVDLSAAVGAEPLNQPGRGVWCWDNTPRIVQVVQGQL